jgi:hypothetical protein
LIGQIVHGVDSSIRYFVSLCCRLSLGRNVRTNTPRFFAEDPRIGSAVLGGMFENPATALAVSGERRESVALDIGAFVPVSAAALTLVDAAGRYELAGPECCAVLSHEGVLLVRGSWCRGAGMIGLPAASYPNLASALTH